MKAGVERLDWSRYLRNRDSYFECPGCGRKTLIRRGRLDMFNPPESPFPPALQAAFGPVPQGLTPYDFACARCGATSAGMRRATATTSGGCSPSRST